MCARLWPSRVRGSSRVKGSIERELAVRWPLGIVPVISLSGGWGDAVIGLITRRSVRISMCPTSGSTPRPPVRYHSLARCRLERSGFFDALLDALPDARSALPDGAAWIPDALRALGVCDGCDR